MTLDIARGLSTNLADAERIKARHGSALQSPSDDKDILTIPPVGEDERDHPNTVRALGADPHHPPARRGDAGNGARHAREVRASPSRSGKRVVLTGGASQLTGLAETARRILGRNVRVGRPLGIAGTAGGGEEPGVRGGGRPHHLPAGRADRAVPRPQAGRGCDDGNRRISRAGGALVQGQLLRKRTTERNGSGGDAGPGGKAERTETMSINLKMPDITELKPRITVFGVGGAGCNAVNNMIEAGLQGVEFVVANTDAQALTMTKADRLIQMGVAVTQGLGAGSQPEIGRAAAEETIDEITDHLNGAHMAFITAGMGGGTGTGAAPIVARAAREAGILTVGVVTKPFQFEGQRRMRVAEAGILELQKHVDTLIVIPNQNLFRIANDKTTFADAFAMADEVLYSGVACITDLMVKDGLINLDFADVRSVMREMGKAMMGTGEASGDKRAIEAAEKAIANPLLDDVYMRGARGLLISITGGRDMTLFEVDEAASRVREEVEATPTSSSARPSTRAWRASSASRSSRPASSRSGRRSRSRRRLPAWPSSRAG